MELGSGVQEGDASPESVEVLRNERCNKIFKDWEEGKELAALEESGLLVALNKQTRVKPQIRKRVDHGGRSGFVLFLGNSKAGSQE